MTSPLFKTFQMGALHLASRVVMAPLTRNRAPGAIPTAMMAKYYRQRANPETGAALIISEGTAISQQGQGYTDVPGLYGSDQIDGWKRITDAVHAEKGLIFCQLWHVGRVSHSVLQPAEGAPVGPSAIRAQAKTFVAVGDTPGRFIATSEPRALQRDEIPGIVHDYAVAARSAVESAGFDGVEIHGANGYLVDQFLKLGANQRHDDYGGSIINRLRFALEVARAVCDAVGADRVGIRISPVTPANGISDPDPQPLFDALMRELAPLGLAYVHVIEGATGGARELADQPFDYAAMKDAFRAAGGTGAWMVNNGYDLALANAAIESGAADLVAFGKPFIGMPDLALRLRRNGPYQEGVRATFYGGGAAGYIDYPELEA